MTVQEARECGLAFLVSAGEDGQYPLEIRIEAAKALAQLPTFGEDISRATATGMSFTPNTPSSIWVG